MTTIADRSKRDKQMLMGCLGLIVVLVALVYIFWIRPRNVAPQTASVPPATVPTVSAKVTPVKPRPTITADSVVKASGLRIDDKGQCILTLTIDGVTTELPVTGNCSPAKSSVVPTAKPQPTPTPTLTINQREERDRPRLNGQLTPIPPKVSQQRPKARVVISVGAEQPVEPIPLSQPQSETVAKGTVPQSTQLGLERQGARATKARDIPKTQYAQRRAERIAAVPLKQSPEPTATVPPQPVITPEPEPTPESHLESKQELEPEPKPELETKAVGEGLVINPSPDSNSTDAPSGSLTITPDATISESAEAGASVGNLTITPSADTTSGAIVIRPDPDVTPSTKTDGPLVITPDGSAPALAEKSPNASGPLVITPDADTPSAKSSKMKQAHTDSVDSNDGDTSQKFGNGVENGGPLILGNEEDFT